MDCDRIREAISAQIDGEDPGLPCSDLEAHLTGCAACREWQRHAHTVTRRARLGGSFLDHDLTPRVLAAVTAARPRRRLRLTLRGVLAALALAQLVISAPMLFLGHDHDAGMHAAHELGSFNLALAIAFAVGAVRPRLSAGLAWPCAIAAAGLVTTAIADMIGGQAIGADEAQHLVVLAGAAVLIWQSNMRDVGSAGPAIMTGEGSAGTQPGITRADAATRLGRTPYRPRGGDAARSTGPGIADWGELGLLAPRDGSQAGQPGVDGDAHDEAVA
jgi:predicted anti-sigma-YlaC factor YlaD